MNIIVLEGLGVPLAVCEAPTFNTSLLSLQKMSTR